MNRFVLNVLKKVEGVCKSWLKGIKSERKKMKFAKKHQRVLKHLRANSAACSKLLTLRHQTYNPYLQGAAVQQLTDDAMKVNHPYLGGMMQKTWQVQQQFRGRNRQQIHPQHMISKQQQGMIQHNLPHQQDLAANTEGIWTTKMQQGIARTQMPINYGIVGLSPRTTPFYQDSYQGNPPFTPAYPQQAPQINQLLSQQPFQQWTGRMTRQQASPPYHQTSTGSSPQTPLSFQQSIEETSPYQQFTATPIQHLSYQQQQRGYLEQQALLQQQYNTDNSRKRRVSILYHVIEEVSEETLSFQKQLEANVAQQISTVQQKIDITQQAVFFIHYLDAMKQEILFLHQQLGISPEQLPFSVVFMKQMEVSRQNTQQLQQKFHQLRVQTNGQSTNLDQPEVKTYATGSYNNSQNFNPKRRNKKYRGWRKFRKDNDKQVDNEEPVDGKDPTRPRNERGINKKQRAIGRKQRWLSKFNSRKMTTNGSFQNKVDHKGENNYFKCGEHGSDLRHGNVCGFGLPESKGMCMLPTEQRLNWQQDQCYGRKISETDAICSDQESLVISDSTPTTASMFTPVKAVSPHRGDYPRTPPLSVLKPVATSTPRVAVPTVKDMGRTGSVDNFMSPKCLFKTLQFSAMTVA